jgi:uncharacterized membrane protein YhaH (DUF805 family)
MEGTTGRPQGGQRRLRDWINPLRLYDPRIPAGRLVFLWGMAVYPVVVIWGLLTVVIIVVMIVFPNISPDYIGIMVWPFMLAWVAAFVAITRRRLLSLGMSQNWIWLAILPVVNLPLLLYLLFKSGPAAGHWGA